MLNQWAWDHSRADQIRFVPTHAGCLQSDLPAAQAPETASPVVPPKPAAAAVIPVAEPRAKETLPQGGSTQGEEEETEGPQAAAAATTNLNSAKAEAKLVKALDYLVAINDNFDNPGQKWVINESILASLRLFQAGDKEIR